MIILTSSTFGKTDIDTATNKSAEVEKPYYKTNREEESYLKLYPNPAYQYLTTEYQIPPNADNAVLEIITLEGVHIETVRLTAGWGEKIIDLRFYQPGTYLIRLYLNGKQVETEKFVKF